MTGYVDSLDWEHATFLKLKILTLNMSAQMAKTTGRILISTARDVNDIWFEISHLLYELFLAVAAF